MTRDRMLLEQGPLLNIGDRTVIYYTACTPHGNLMGSMSNIGMAVLPRERFGSLTPVANADFGQAVTNKIHAGSVAELFANVELDQGGRTEAALTDADGLTELPGYELQASWTLTESGFKQRITWRGRRRPCLGSPSASACASPAPAGYTRSTWKDSPP